MISPDDKLSVLDVGSADSSYKLSPAQHGMLYQSLYGEQAGVYIQQFVCSLRHELNVSAFKSAWQRVADRHSVFRTCFHWRRLNEPIQEVRRKVLLPIEENDWRDSSVTEYEARLNNYLDVDQRRGFEFSEPPLMRLALFQLAKSDYRFVWTSHHALLDGRSRLLIVKEVFALYEAFCKEQDLALAQPLPFENYIDELQQQDLIAAETFWRETLKGFTGPTPLVGAQGFDQESGQGKYREHRFEVTELETSALQSLAGQHELTLNTLVQGAWALLLSRYCGSGDIVFGLTKSCRRKSASSMIGLLINTLPVRVSISSETLLLPYLKELRAYNLALRAHEDTPLVKIREWSDVPGNSPLFESLLVFENYELNSTLQTLGGDWVNREFRLFEKTNYPLLLAGCLKPKLSMKFAYDAERFDETAIRRMAGHFSTLLRGFASGLDQPVGSLPLMTPSEIDQITQWTRTESDYRDDKCVHELFEEQAESTPDALAIVHGNQKLSYQALNERANQLAHHLLSLGVGPESRVGICVERSMEMVVGLLGILKAGAAYVPLDPQYPQQRLSFMMEDADVSVLLTQQSLLGRLIELKREATTCLDSDWPLIAQQSSENPASEVTAGNLAYLIYTSGSTGLPKGVAITHRSTLAMLCWALERFPSSALSSVLASTSICFDISVFELFAPLSCGGNVVLVRDVLELIELPPGQSVSLINTVPSAFVELLRAGALPSSVEVVNLAGEALAGKLVQAAYQQDGVREVYNLYGPSEDTTYSMYALVPKGEQEEPTIGTAITNTQVYLLDSRLQLVPVGIPGELYIGGAGLARGYWNRTELTAEKFIPHPYSEVGGARLYRTGDLAKYRADGEIEFIGRIDEQVKLRGYRIELGEIESVLNGHPAVAESVVMARVDAGNTDQQLVAYVVLNEVGQKAGINGLRPYVQEKLPHYMVPAQWIVIDQMPLTPNGKIDRRSLPKPDQAKSELESAFVAARTPEEEILSGIFEQVLKVKQVGIHDNFFMLGGHSLLATQVMSRIRQGFHVELPMTALFKANTVAALARLIKERGRNEPAIDESEIGAVSRKRVVPLSFAQQRLWFFEQLVPDSSVYNVPLALRLQGKLDGEVLERSFSEIVRRHEALRTSCLIVDEEAMQVIGPAKALKIPVIDLSQLPPVERSIECSRIAGQQLREPFDLEKGPLLRVSLLRLGEAEHVLVVIMHHIITDGWSMDILLRELGQLYGAYSEGNNSPLEELAIQYSDFAQWQREWLSGETLEKQLGYWRNQLEGAPPVLELPTDHARPAVQSHHGSRRSKMLSPALAESLKRLSQREGVTLFMTLLAGFQTLLYRYSSQEDFCIGADIASRNRAEVEPLIGFFINMLVLRADLSGNPSFRELLNRVKEVCLGAYAHQDVPFEKLVEELQPERALSHKPLFQVVLSLQNIDNRETQLTGLRLELVEFENDTAKCDLTLLVNDSEAGLSTVMVYSTDLFESETIERMLVHLEVVLEALVKDVEQSVGEVVLLTAAEQEQLEQWNQTAAEYPTHKSVHELFEAQVENTPEAVAVSYEDRQLSYQELNERANQLAHYLRELGVGAETKVGICIERSIEMVTAMLATLKAGGAYVPLDPDYPRERLCFMIADAEVTLLLTQERLVRHSLENREKTIRLDCDWPLIAKQSRENLSTEVSTGNLAYLIYTSGSTGVPKAVAISHQSLLNLIGWHQQTYHLESRTRASQVASFSFDAAVWEIWSCLCSGNSLYILDDETRTQPEALRDWLVQKQITAPFLPTPLGESVMDLANADLGQVRSLLVGGDRLVKKPRGAESYEVINHYGPTEATVVATAGKVEAAAEGSGLPTIGTPIGNVQVYVLDGRQRLVPVGIVGELYIGGAGLARGYWKRAELTAEKFIPHPYSEVGGARLYRTGDLAKYRADGEIEFIGRIDEQVKLRGYRIELGEIESVLNGHPAVAESVVTARVDAGNTDQRLVAYVVLNDVEQMPTNGELKIYVQERLPAYMLPAAFVCLTQLPLTANGKIDRQALPHPDETRPDLGTVFVAPRTAEEEILAEIFQQVLKVECVGIHDSFFDLGGHSLRATQVVSRIRRHFNLDLPLTALFKAPTVASLLQLIEELLIAEITTLPEVEPDWVQ